MTATVPPPPANDPSDRGDSIASGALAAALFRGRAPVWRHLAGRGLGWFEATLLASTGCVSVVRLWADRTESSVLEFPWWGCPFAAMLGAAALVIDAWAWMRFCRANDDNYGLPGWVAARAFACIPMLFAPLFGLVIAWLCDLWNLALCLAAARALSQRNWGSLIPRLAGAALVSLVLNSFLFGFAVACVGLAASI